MGPVFPIGLASAPETPLPPALSHAAGDPGCTRETWVVYVDDILIVPTPGPKRSRTEAVEQSAEADDATEGATVPRQQKVGTGQGVRSSRLAHAAAGGPDTTWPTRSTGRHNDG